MVRILVVDDDSSVVVLLDRVLQAAGHGVITARTGAEAVFKLQAYAFEVLLVDKHLPDLHGGLLIDLARDLHPHIAVVLTTARTDPFHTRLSYDAFLPKPYLSLDAPGRAVDEALGRRRAASLGLRTAQESRWELAMYAAPAPVR